MQTLRINTRLLIKSLSFSRRELQALVIAEYPLGPGTLSTINAARKINEVKVNLLVVNPTEACLSIAKKTVGVDKVLHVSSPSSGALSAEVMTELLSGVVKEYDYVLTSSTNFGKNYLPRLATLFQSSPLSEVSAVIDPNTFQRPIYAASALATVKMTDKIKVK